MAVRGNHEDMLLRAAGNLWELETWIANGGRATLASFQVDYPGEIPRPYRSYLRSLPYYLLLDDFVIVHAGLNFDVSDPFSDTEAMLWQRDCVVDQKRTGGRRLVSGHTAITRKQVEASLGTNRVMLDNGCVFANDRPGMGSLVALELNTMTLAFQENIDL
jgi:serine/threonine protein phosphatase 1